MPQPLLRGAITALATPFRDGEVDRAAFVRLVERQVAAGVHGVVVAGTTGEAPTLSEDEYGALVALCVETVAGRIPVIAGTGSNSTAHAVALTRRAKAAGADAALVAAPYYNRPSQEGMRLHFTAIAKACDLPVVLYNVPSRTASDIANETVVQLSQAPGVVGIKDATGDLARMSLLRLACAEGFAFLSGDDPTALGYVAHGGHGVISVTSNVAPETCARQMEHALAGRFDEALALQDALIVLHKALFLDSSPAPTKFALAELGLCTEDVRLPLAPCAEAVRPAVREALRAAMSASGAL